MRITQGLLHKFARETVKQRQRSEPDLHAAYLTGSLLSDSPLLGGSTDIDLVLVHKYQVPVDRETLGITNEVSLDIYHRLQEDYDQHRQLRQDPWIGYPLIKYHILLFDTDHWLEFIQSSVSADYHRPDNVLARVNLFMTKARSHWFSLTQNPPQTHLEWLDRYLETLALAANAIAGLIGPPLTTRRFLMHFSQRVDTLGVPNLLIGLNGLLGFSEEAVGNLSTWIEGFEEDYENLFCSVDPPVHLAKCRQNYYLHGLQAILQSETPEHAIWPLLRTWSDVHLASPELSAENEKWVNCLNCLNLNEDQLILKTDALDAYLDTLEIHIETWSDTYGL